MSNISRQILSDVIVHMKYARYDKKKKRRETWEEIVDRYKKMMVKKYPKLKSEIEDTCKYIYDKKVLPSMRFLQFAGKAIEKNECRGYNCTALALSHIDSFKELAFLLMSGCGVGYSVQLHHISQLPEIKRTNKKRRFLVADTIEGWAEAIGALINFYFNIRKSEPDFDFSDIRERGDKLRTSGGTAPGPEPLKDCLHNIRRVFSGKKDGQKLTSLEAHDIACYIADCVVVGGTRRSSCISLFSFRDKEMLECKFGDWYVNNPQRGRANNSAVILRHKIKEEEFKDFFKKVEQSGSGEPGWIFSNTSEQLTNPCQPGWATVLTVAGIKKLDDVDIGDNIWTEEGFSPIVNKVCTGEKKVYKFATTSGVFYGTENHNIICEGEKIKVNDSDSIDYLTCDYNIFVNKKQMEDKLWHIPTDTMDGLIIGDGTVHKASNNLVLLCVGQDDTDYFNSDIAGLIKKHRVGINSGRYEIETTIKHYELPRTFEREIPDRYFYGNFTKVCSFLRGLYSANGSVCDNRVTLKQSSLKIIEQVQMMLSFIGIRSYYTTNKPTVVTFNNGDYKCKQSYDLNITSDKDLFLSLVGFIQKYKNNKVRVTTKNAKTKTRLIISKEYVSTESVYSITVGNKKHTYWTGGMNVANCGEVSLRVQLDGTGSMCNLSEINTTDLSTQKEFNKRAVVASFLATLQAGFTAFHFLRETWQESVEKEGLIGVSITGIASGNVLKLNMNEAAKCIIKENERVADLIGINPAYRTTTTKPSGSASLVLGCSSGIHAWHAPFYIRRIRVGKDEFIYKYLEKKHPELIDDDYFKPTTQAVISIPIKAPDDAITRKETALQQLDRVSKVYTNWVKPGHIKGDNTNNVSCTITIKKNEWERVGRWLWENRENYTSISVLPYSDHSYVQAPFEEIDEETYNKMIKELKKVDLTKVIEEVDNTNLQGEVACSGGACEIV